MTRRDSNFAMSLFGKETDNNASLSPKRKQTNTILIAYLNAYYLSYQVLQQLR